MGSLSSNPLAGKYVKATRNNGTGALKGYAVQEYAYNIRSWVSGISGPAFTQRLHYTDGLGTPCFAGNISSMSWKSGNETTERGYKFTYDANGNMTKI